MKALVIGATGATGKDLVETLLKDDDYTQVVTFVRRVSGLSHPKLTEVVTDFDNLESVADHINGDVWFSCLGTTLKAAGSKERQWHIDYEMPIKFANVAKRNGVRGLVLLSAYGASSRSRVFFSNMKGRLEEELGKIGFDPYVIFRPGLLLRKNTDRTGEKVSEALLKFFNRLGIAKRFKPLPTAILAAKLAKAGKSIKEGKKLVELDGVFDF